MNLSTKANELFLMANPFMLATERGHLEVVGGKLVRHYRGHVYADIVSNDVMQGASTNISSANESQISAALTDADNDFFLWNGAMPTRFATNVGLVNLYSAIQQRCVDLLHGVTDAVAEIPSSLVADTEGALNLIRGHSLARFAQQIGCKKPLPQREMGVIEDCSGGHGELIAA